MKIIGFIVVLIVLTACDKKSTHELIHGDWKVTSWKTKSKYTGYKQKEKLKGEMHVIFEKDSLHLILDKKKETFHYLIKGDSIFVTEDKLGFYRIKLIDGNNLHLYKEINLTYNSEDTIEEKLHSEINIKLSRK